MDKYYLLNQTLTHRLQTPYEYIHPFIHYLSYAVSLLSSVVARSARFILPISLHLKHAVAISIPTALRCVALTLYNPLSSCLSSSPVERAQWIFLLNVLKHLGILISPSNHLDKGHFELTSGISNDQSLPTF